MQNKNFLLFLMVTFAILTGWTLVQNWLWPPPPRPPATPEQAKLVVDPAVWAGMAAQAAALNSGGPGVGNAAPLGAALVVANRQPEIGRAALAGRRETEKRLALEAAWTGLAAPAAAVNFGALGIGSATPLAATLSVANRLPEVERAALAWRREAEKRLVLEAENSYQTIPMGDNAFNLKVELTTRGGGVESVVLPKFQAASRMGLPEDARLALLPEEVNRLHPSNLLFHYPQPDDKHPVDTLGKVPWTVEVCQTEPGAARHKVVLAADVPGQDIRIRKTYTLDPGDYHIGLALEIERKPGGSPAPVKFRYQLTSGHGLPIEGVWYTYTFRDALIGVLSPGGKLIRDFQESRSISFKEGGTRVNKPPDKSIILYAGVKVQYFASLLVVDNEQEKTDFIEWARPTLPLGAVPDEKQPFLDDIVVRVGSEPIELLPGQKVEHKYLLYNGPVKVKLLGELAGGGKAVSPELIDRYVNQLHLNTLTDYQNQQPGIPGWFGSIASTIRWTDLLILCTNLMHNVLGFLHAFIPNYGVCIIVLTLMVRGLMFPISRRQQMSSMKMQAKMKELEPEVKKLEEKFKNDPGGLQRAKSELYLRRGIHPLAMAGTCWIVFLQMPIFMGLYYALQESIHFRLAPFLWIKNLAAPDMLWPWGEGIPWISRPVDMGSFFYLGPFFNLLPLIAVSFMLVQQKMMTPPPTNEQEEMQQKMMKFMMIFMGLFFYKVAAGLCVYFIVSSLWGLAERKLIPKMKLAAAAPPAPPGKGTAGEGGKPGPTRPGPRAPKPNGDGIVQKVKDWWQEVLKEASKK